MLPPPQHPSPAGRLIRLHLRCNRISATTPGKEGELFDSLRMTQRSWHPPVQVHQPLVGGGLLWSSLKCIAVIFWSNGYMFHVEHPVCTNQLLGLGGLFIKDFLKTVLDWDDQAKRP